MSSQTMSSVIPELVPHGPTFAGRDVGRAALISQKLYSCIEGGPLAPGDDERFNRRAVGGSPGEHGAILN